MRVIKSNNEVLVEETKVKQKRKDYFEKFLNQENPREIKNIRTEKRDRDVGNISVKKKQKCVEEDEEAKSSRS